MENRQNSLERLRQELGFEPPAGPLSPAELEELLAAATALRSSPTPLPTAAETDRLAALAADLVAPPPSEVARALEAGGRASWLAEALAAVRPQVRILRRPFWLASAAVVAAGLPLLDTGLRSSLGIDLTYGGFLLIIAPVLAALGVAYAFRSAGTGMVEVEMACPLSPVQLLLGRLFWVTAYDAALLGAASLAAAGLEPGMRLGFLLVGWLAPMLLLAAGVLALSLYLPPWAGAGVGLALWAALLGAGLQWPHLYLPALAGSPAILPAAALFGLGAALLLAALTAAAPRLLWRLAGVAGGEGV